MIILGSLVLLASHLVAGYRLHLWLDHHMPDLYLPKDAGAWTGLAVGLYFSF